MRLIDADALLEGREDHEMISTHLIWNAPTVDAEPVRHGRWLEYNSFYYELRFKCSVCCNPTRMYKPLWKYCPNCGAKMDEERRTDAVE